MANLLLHCGAAAAPREALAATPTPAATRTHHPMPHETFVSEVESMLPEFNLKSTNQSHALTHDGARYFGLMELQQGSGDHASEDYTWVLGLRNAHDKSFSAGVCAGSQVFVCDNLAFSGEVNLARKHTRHLIRDFPNLLANAMDKLVNRWHFQDRRIEAYKGTDLSDGDAHDLVIQSLDRGVVSSTQIPKVLNEWRKPSHEAFESRNTWSLFNAFTETMKGKGLHQLPRRTQALHGLCDQFVGLAN